MPAEENMETRTWTREVNGATYTCSTATTLIQLDALNDAFASDMLWWAKAQPADTLAKTVRNSLCFGIYTSNNDGSAGTKMVAFARLITDYVTFGYLTDVYVLREFQGKGLGKWMMTCLKEVLDGWETLRRCVLFTGDAEAVRLYETTLGMKDVREGGNGLIIMQMMGNAGAPGKPQSD
ncbi:hypothetical protein B0T16DRAFT_206142 [Cercophora newfieldiana]|uniref:N-acetyltransferase domain-containing protein n=1 Tax=Cercophora newfieldiana TaxID=92897 RepID=A0AA39XWC9_9PEZI|nr:hypothetical protein B0T16DRAFT_206142 [Cercophora newfieldiana]